jgi:transcription-repair coupling factor (superfamily II helicase)
MRAHVRKDQKLVFARDWPTADQRLKGTAAILARLARLAEGKVADATPAA